MADRCRSPGSSVARADRAGSSSRIDSPGRESTSSSTTARPRTSRSSTAVLGGVAVLDFDNDGRLDVFFANGAPDTRPGEGRPAILEPPVTATRATAPFATSPSGRGSRGEGYSMGASVGRLRQRRLDRPLRDGGEPQRPLPQPGRRDVRRRHRAGRGAGVERRREGSSGRWAPPGSTTTTTATSTSSSSTTSTGRPRTTRSAASAGRRLSCSPNDYGGLPNLLYRNEGGGPVHRRVRADGDRGARRQGHERRRWPTPTGTGSPTSSWRTTRCGTSSSATRAAARFAETGVETGVAYTEDGVPVSGMGADFRDLDQDGRPDIFVTALSGEPLSPLPEHPRGVLPPDLPRGRPGLRDRHDGRLGHRRLRPRQRRLQGPLHRATPT